MSNLELGFKLVEHFLSQKQLTSVCEELDGLALPRAAGGVRNAEKKYKSIEALVSSQFLMDHASKYLPGAPCFVRAILFNKTPENNWLVAWHQDKTVTVSKKIQQEGWGPWSIKDGVQHVQPPVEILNSMVTFRVHLDNSTKENGCLSVIPASHLAGVLSQRDIATYTQKNQSVLCEGTVGSALIMRPHLLHSSGKGTAPSKRRVLHIEFSSYVLPEGLAWV